MHRRFLIGIGLTLSFLALVSCGTEDATTAPKPLDGVLFRASDVEGMRLLEQEPIADATEMAEVLGGPESCACPTVFKDDVPVAAEKLADLGFQRGYLEQWGGAGVRALGFAAGFDTADNAKAAIGYMDKELFRECIDEPYCSKRARIKNAEVSDFVGVALTPLRPKEEGRQATFYKFLFRSGSTVYIVMDGADNAYDPGSVSEAQALALVEDLFDRVKDRDIDEVLRSAPKSRRGPPHGPPGPPPGEGSPPPS